jgi:competence CoiA-like predicted nuclease
MQFAIDYQNNRISPTKTGQQAFCPGCMGEVISSCGKIKIWHWRHKVSECDSWYEPESEWHRNWKECFDSNEREVIIKKDDVWHRADVYTKKGIVIEFQNSSISPEEIQAREEFYDKMIWVLNGQKFKLEIDTSTEKLKQEIFNALEYNLNEFEFDLNRKKYMLEENIRSLENNFYTINIERVKLYTINKSLKNTFHNINNYVEEIIEKWINSNFEYEYNTQIKILEIQNRFIKEINLHLKNFTLTYFELKKKEKHLAYILSLIDYKLDLINHKIIPSEKIPNRAFKKVKALLFVKNKIVDVKYFFDIKELFRFKLIPNNYVFIIECDETIEKLYMEIDSLRKIIAPFDKKINDLKSDVKYDIKNSFEYIIKENEKKIKQYEIKTEESKKLIESYNSRLEKFENEKENIIDSKRKELINNHPFLIDINKGKDIVFYSWKNQHKSWAFSSKSIYFDVGDEFLYEILNESFLCRIKKTVFIENHSNSFLSTIE